MNHSNPLFRVNTGMKIKKFLYKWNIQLLGIAQRTMCVPWRYVKPYRKT